MRFTTTIAVCALAALLTSCGLLGGGETNRSDPPGGTAPAQGASVRGTVQAVDAKAQTLTVSAEASPQLSLRNADRQVLGYDASTAVNYQGRTYRPADLEVGDRIEATVERSGDRLMARRIDVLSTASTEAGMQNLPATLEATVRWVDNSNQTIELEPVTGDRRAVVAHYDARTRVEYDGRAYQPEDLERGDVVRVRTRSAEGPLVADEISVVRNSRAAGAGPAQQPSADHALLRGTIRQIDAGAKRIALDSAAWTQSFDERAGPAASGVVVFYDAQTVVEYQGKRYGIANLEPGDQVEIEVERGGADYRAQRIVVTRGT
jgi:hypothetical protein